MTRNQITAALEPYTYKRPQNYIGATHHGTYTVAATHRDADTVTRANWLSWQEILEPYIGSHDDSPVYTAPTNHWAVGWHETLQVKHDAPTECLRITLETLQALEDYPVLNDETLSDIEWEEINDAMTDYGYQEIAEENGIEWHDLTNAQKENITEQINDQWLNGYGNNVYHDGNNPVIHTDHFTVTTGDG